jgi:RNA polymerase sigma factor (sigma-70 family)
MKPELLKTATKAPALSVLNYKKSTDNELVILYQNGDDYAFEILVKRHKTRVYNTIFQIVRERSSDPQFLAKDLSQDAFIKVVDSIRKGNYREENRFLPWLLRIARNLAIDHYRRSKRIPTVSLDNITNSFDGANAFEPATENYFDDHEKYETHHQLRYHIEQLPETQREVLLLRHFAGLSFKEIADMTDVSINTALGRMRYALINLRKKLSSTQTDFHESISNLE